MRDGILEPFPQLEPAEEFGFLVDELAMRLIGGGLRFQRALAGILHRQRTGHYQHLTQAVMIARCENHPADTRIEWQPGKLAPDRRELVGVVHCAEFLQQVVAVGNRPARRRFEEGEVLDIAKPQRLHAQDHRRQRGPQNLGIGKARPRLEVAFLVQPDTNAVGHPAATSGTLVGGRLGDGLDLQLLDLVAVGVALDAREPGIDHVADTRHGQRGFGDVGCQHDTARVGRLEHALLLLHRQAREQRQDFRMHPGAAKRMLAQRLGGFANFPLTRQEHQHVAVASAAQFLDGFDDGIVQIAILVLVGSIGLHRPVADFHRIQPPADLDHRRGTAGRGEMAGKPLGVDRGRGNDDLQIRPLRQQLLEIAEQKIDIEAALMRLVDDDCVVCPQQRIALRFRQQNAVGHQLDRGAGRQCIVETDLVAHMLAYR